MNQNAITPAQWEMLIRYISQKLGMTPQELAQTVRRDGVQGLFGSLSPENAQKLQALLGDPAQAERLANSPEMQQALKKLAP